MEIVLQFLDQKVRDEFRALSEEDLAPASTALSVFMKKRLMEVISNNSKRKIQEVIQSETFDEEKCKQVLGFLKVDFQSLSNVLHSGELVVSSVYQTLTTLATWGAITSLDQAVSSLWSLHQKTNMIQQHKKETKNTLKVNKTTNSAITKNHSSHTVCFEDLSPLAMKNLILFKIHRGYFIKGKLVGYPVVTTGVTQLLSDENGHFITIGVYNLLDVKTNEQFENLYPRGSWIKIKEPYFKIFDNGERGVRIDTPSDIEIFDTIKEPETSNEREEPIEHKPKVKVESCEDLRKKLSKVKTKGNQLFIEKQYNQALQTYMSGIRSTKSYLKTSLEPILKEKGTAANSSASLDFIHYVCDSLLLLVDNTSKQFSEKDQSIVNLVKSRIKFQETKLHILNDETSPLRDLVNFLETCIEFGLICCNISICYKELKFYTQSSLFARVVPHFNVAESIKQKCSRRVVLCQFLSGQRKRLNKIDIDWYSLNDDDTQYFGQLEKQASTGHGYNWDKIVEKYMQPNSENFEFDVADYIGPVDFKEIPGKGLGTVARQPIKKGELVMVSKALWQRKRDEKETVSDTLSAQLTLSGPQVQLAQDIIHRCKSDDLLTRKLKALHSSSKFTRIKYKDVMQGNLDRNTGIESERVGYAVKFNTFGSNTNFLSKDCNNSTIAGLWFEPSFLNHDDNPNVCWAVIGNLMVARASSDIAVGQELTITYTCELRYAERESTLKNYGFEYRIQDIPDDVIRSVVEASNKVTELKLASQKSKKEKQKQEILNKAISLNNNTIGKFQQYLQKNQALNVSLLYDQMDLYLAVGNYNKAKESLIEILTNHSCYVNEDLLKTAFTSFPKVDTQLLNCLEQVTSLIYGTRNLPQIYFLYKIKPH